MQLQLGHSVIDRGVISVIAGSPATEVLLVVVIAVYIGADTVAIHVADIRAIIEDAGAVAIGVQHVVNGGGVAVIAVAPTPVYNTGVVIIAVDVGADAIAVNVTNTGTGGGGAGAIAIGVNDVVMVVLSSIVQGNQ